MKIKTKKYIIPIVAIGLLISVGFSRSDFNAGRNIETLFNVVRSLNVLYVDTIDNEKLTRTGIDAMLKTLDPYTSFISKEEMADFKIMTTGKFGGVGSYIRKAYGSDYVVFDVATSGSPVDKSGISPGDTIMAVDGVKITEDKAVSEAMRGTPGTDVNLTVKSIADGSTKDYLLTRKTISQPPINYAGVTRDSIGYIGFTDFTSGSGEIFRSELKRLKKEYAIKGLILDLRSNGGGIIDESITLLSSFLPKGTHVTSLKGRSGISRREYSTTQAPIDTLLPLVVIINEDSASASEIVAGAIQDYDRGVIIGEKSVGKGLVQSTQDVGYGNMIKITIAKYYIPSGRCIQEIDYSNRDNKGLANKITDSLRNKFYTKNGREMRDGGGIEPDVKVEPEYMGLFAASIYARRYHTDYANIYAYKNPEISNLRDFKISDSEFEKFKEFIIDKPIEFTPITSIKLDETIKFAKREGYYDKIKGELDAIDKILKERNTLKAIDENKDTIKEMLALEIVARYYYMNGRVEYAILTDKYVEKAEEILENRTEYKKILSKSTNKPSVGA